MTDLPDGLPNENYVRAMLDNAARGDPRKPDRIRRRRTLIVTVVALFVAVLIAAIATVVIITDRHNSPKFGNPVDNSSVRLLDYRVNKAQWWV